MGIAGRAVGYCNNVDCEDYCKGTFLLNYGTGFYCHKCRRLGKLEVERGHYVGSSDMFKEVRVEFNYAPVNDTYREIAIVRDEGLWGSHNTYTLQSPLIKTERRALKVAEAILANLNRYRVMPDDGIVPKTSEIILSLDEPRGEFFAKLKKLQEEWEESGLRERRKVIRDRSSSN